MATGSRFEEMDVWKRASNRVCSVYRITREGDFARDFVLRDQIRGAAISVPSTIAEGYERDSDKAFAQMLVIAKGSAGELRTQLYIAAKLGYIDNASMQSLVAEAEEISRMLAGVIKHLRQS